MLPPVLLFLFTICPTAYGDFDSAEFATAVPCGGVPHAPGYPLYVLFARFVAALVPGERALAVNLASTVASAMGLALLHRLVLVLTGNPFAGVVAAWSLGASFTYWLMSIVAEVYVPQAAVELAAFLALASGSVKGMATMLGLGLANHPSTVLVGGPLLLWVRAEGPLRAQLAGAMGGLACRLLSPGLLYLYFPLACRFSSHPGFWIRELGLDLARPADLWWYMTLKAYPAELYRREAGFIWGELAYSAHCLLEDFGAAGTLLALAGMGLLARRRPAAGSALALAVGIQIAFYAAFTADDKYTMFCPAFALVAVGLGVGAAGVLELAGPGPKRWAMMLLLLLIPLERAAVHYPRANLSGYRASIDYADAALSRLPGRAVVMAGWQAATVLDYFAVTSGREIEVRHHGLALLAASRRIGAAVGDVRSSESIGEELAAIAETGRPVFTSFGTPELAAHLSRTPAGLLWRLSPRPAPLFLERRPQDWPATAIRSLGVVDLLELKLEPPEAAAGALVRLRFRWRLRGAAALDTPVKTSLRDPADRRVVLLGHEQRRFQHHRLGMLRAAGSSGEYLEETFDFTLGPAGSSTEIRPGRYELHVGLAEGPSGRAAGLTVLAPEGGVRP